MKKIRNCLIIISVLFSTGCKFKSESKEWRNIIQESVGKITEVIDGVSLAIPGERYARLLEASRTGTTEEKEKARKDIIAIFGVDPNSGTQSVSVSFQFTRMQPIEAALAMNVSNKRVDLEKAIEEGRINVQSVGSDIQPPLTDNQLRESIKNEIRTALNNMAGNYKLVSIDKTDPSLGQKLVIWPESYLVPTSVEEIHPQNRNGYRTFEAKIAGLTNKRDGTAEALTSAIWKLREPLKARTKGLNNIEFDWSPIEGSIAFVLIEKSDFEEIKKEYSTKLDEPIALLSIHQKGDPSKTLKNIPPNKLKISHFEANEIIKVKGKGEFYYISENLTGAQFINEQTFNKLEELKKQIEKLKNLN